MKVIIIFKEVTSKRSYSGKWGLLEHFLTERGLFSKDPSFRYIARVEIVSEDSDGEVHKKAAALQRLCMDHYANDVPEADKFLAVKWSYETHDLQTTWYFH